MYIISVKKTDLSSIYGFVVGSEDVEPYCRACMKACSIGSLIPPKMKLHLQRRDPALAESPITSSH